MSMTFSNLPNKEEKEVFISSITGRCNKLDEKGQMVNIKVKDLASFYNIAFRDDYNIPHKPKTGYPHPSLNKVNDPDLEKCCNCL